MKSRFATSVIFLGMSTAPLYAQTVNWSVDSNHSDAFAISSASLSLPAILFWLSVLVMIGFFLYPFIRVNRALEREEDRLRRHDPNEAGTESATDEEIVVVEQLELSERADDLFERGKEIVNETKEEIAAQLDEAGTPHTPEKSKANGV